MNKLAVVLLCLEAEVQEQKRIIRTRPRKFLIGGDDVFQSDSACAFLSALTTLAKLQHLVKVYAPETMR